jgi:hypothetical protein
VAPTGPKWDSVLAALLRHSRYPGGARHATAETNRRRAAFFHERGALSGNDVLVLGEDVSVSAAIALAGKVLSPSGRLARRVVALHTDDSYLIQLRDLAVSERTIIGLVTHNLYHPLPKDLQGEFDTVVVDPPYGIPTLALYLSRAVEAAKKEGARIFLSYRHTEPDERLEVQRPLLDMCLAVEQILPDFDRYSDGSSGDLYYLRPTRDTAPLIEGEYVDPAQPIQGHSVINTFVCTACHSQVTTLGDSNADVWAEQRALNSSGCPTCGGSTLEPIYSRPFGKNGKGSLHDN